MICAGDRPHHLRAWIGVDERSQALKLEASHKMVTARKEDVAHGPILARSPDLVVHGSIESVSIDIQIWSDIACPWCFIGKRRFEKALEEFPQRDQVSVTWRSYQLDPSLPEHSDLHEIDYLVQAKGMPRDQIEQMIGQVGQVAAEVGLHYDFDRLVVANSRRAHRVLQAAKRADAVDGGSRTDALKEALLSAHFEKGGDVGDGETLVSLAVDAGLERDVATEALESAELDRAVQDDIATAGQIGVRGVPFFVVDSKYGISGAQPPELFLEVLNTALSEQTPSLITVDGGAGEACGPEGC